MTSASERDRWLDTLGALGRKATIGVVVAAGIGVIASIILWDTDFYTAREKWETFKNAAFGKWNPKERCVVGHKGCQQEKSFEDAFKDIVDFNFFRSTRIAGTSVEVVTGSAYSSSADVLAGRVHRRWCYVNLGTGNVGTRIELATQSGNGKPTYLQLGAVPPEVLAPLNVTAKGLEALARTHCRFNRPGGT